MALASETESPARLAPQAARARASSRADYLDLFKTMLVWGMVTAHVIQLLGLRLGDAANSFSDFINLISFSGYMAAFGLGLGLSKSNRKRGWRETLQPALVMLACVYTSSLGFVVLVQHKDLTPDLLVDLFSFRVLFGYSEFLASFFVLYVLIALFRPVFVMIAERPILLVATTVLYLLSAYLTTDELIPFAGTIIGHHKYASFPLLAYLPWFLVGIRFGRRDGAIRPLDWLLAAIASGAFVYFLWRGGFNLPDRFPPGILWVVGPALALLAYLAVAKAAGPGIGRLPALLTPGKHVLAAVVFSNLVIFTTGRLLFKPARTVIAALAIALAIMVATTLWCTALDYLLAARRRARGR